MSERETAMRDINSIQVGEVFTVNPAALDELDKADLGEFTSEMKRIGSPVKILYRDSKIDSEGDLGIKIEGPKDCARIFIRENWTRYTGTRVALEEPLFISSGNLEQRSKEGLYCSCPTPRLKKVHLLSCNYNYCLECKREHNYEG
jgi:hypothetical protein